MKSRLPSWIHLGVCWLVLGLLLRIYPQSIHRYVLFNSLQVFGANSLLRQIQSDRSLLDLFTLAVSWGNPYWEHPVWKDRLEFSLFLHLPDLLVLRTSTVRLDVFGLLFGIRRALVCTCRSSLVTFRRSWLIVVPVFVILRPSLCV